MVVFMSVNSSHSPSHGFSWKLKHHSLGRGVPWMSWVGSMKSTPQGWCGPCGLPGWMDFFSPSIKWIDLKEFRRSPEKKPWRVTSGHRSRFFFCFPPSFEHFSGLLEYSQTMHPQKIPRKVIRIIEIGTLCFFFPELARGRYASETFSLFFSHWFPKKVEDHLKE